MEKALSVPEIRRYIGLFLSLRDLKNCVILSKTWAESLTPWLWWSFKAQPNDGPSYQETLSKHAGHVRSLYLGHYTLSKEQYDQFRALRVIKLGYDPTNPTYEDDSTTLIKRNRLTLWSLHAMDCQKMPTETLRTIFDSPSLKNLSLIFLVLREKKLAEELLQTCTRLTRLEISMLNSADWSMLCTPTQVFHHLTSLRITALEHPDHLGFLKACPNLRILVTTLKDTITPNEFTDALLSSCPKLRMLLYSHQKNNFVIESMSQLIQGLPPMKCFQVNTINTIIQATTFNLLSRHFASLQVIELRAPSGCCSSNIQIILTSCPSLRYFSGGTLYSQDIDPQAPWVCLGLEHFNVQTQWHSGEQPKQSLIWSQISRLTRLCSLTIGANIRPSIPSNITSLGLDEGLMLLEPLKRLAHLEILGSSVKWHEKEVEWVIQSWPSLCSIQGKIQRFGCKRKKLWERLNSAGIFYRNHNFVLLEYINDL